jgi:hypothetical protein
MLKAVVGHDDIDGAAGQKLLDVGDPIRAGYDGTTGSKREQHGLVADLLRLAVGGDALGPTLGLPAVPATDDARAEPALGESRHEPNDERRLARAADGEIADYDHGDLEVHAFELVALPARGGRRGVDRAKRPKDPLGPMPFIPDGLE